MKRVEIFENEMGHQVQLIATVGKPKAGVTWVDIQMFDHLGLSPHQRMYTLKEALALRDLLNGVLT